MVQLGMRKARYFGRAKTLFQALMAATVANLSLIARKAGEMDIESSVRAGLHLLFVRLKMVTDVIRHHWASRIRLPDFFFGLLCPSQIPSFRPGF